VACIDDIMIMEARRRPPVITLISRIRTIFSAIDS
jgi:hypothetical protein